MSVYEVNYTQRSSSVPRGVRHLEKHVEVARATPEQKFLSSSARNSEHVLPIVVWNRGVLLYGKLRILLHFSFASTIIVLSVALFLVLNRF